MGLRIVRVTCALLKELFREGATWPSRAGQRLRVMKGLPADAELVGMSSEALRQVVGGTRCGAVIPRDEVAYLGTDPPHPLAITELPGTDSEPHIVE